MPRTKSPLRYPGGKTQLTKFVEHTIELNQIRHPIYCEGFSGGAGVAMALLLDEKVDKIILNDFDIAIYSFWKAILDETENFINFIKDIDITIDTWYKEKQIYDNLKDSTEYDFYLGAATFFLNRTNRAGIITGGPIGGFKQDSRYSIDCRFNKDDLIKKIREISLERERIELYNLDAVDLINTILVEQSQNSLFVYFDPPYYKQGKNLYKNAFNDEKHVDLSNAICAMNNYHWIATYDNNPRIENIYHDMDIRHYSLQYSANRIRREQEIFFHSPITQVESFDKVQFD